MLIHAMTYKEILPKVDRKNFVKLWKRDSRSVQWFAKQLSYYSEYIAVGGDSHVQVFSVVVMLAGAALKRAVQIQIDCTRSVDSEII